jgi:aldehyde:ferredoxin oxidoreductase
MFTDYMSDIDELLGEIKSKIIEEVEVANKETIERLTKENADLKKANDLLTKAANRVAAADDNYTLFNFLMKRIKRWIIIAYNII